MQTQRKVFKNTVNNGIFYRALYGGKFLKTGFGKNMVF